MNELFVIKCGKCIARNYTSYLSNIDDDGCGTWSKSKTKAKKFTKKEANDVLNILTGNGAWFGPWTTEAA